MIAATSCGLTRSRAAAAPPASSTAAAVERTLIIYYAGAAGKETLLQAAKQYGATVVHQYDALSGLALRLPAAKPLPEAEKYFRAVPGVLSVSRDAVQQLH